jgi:tetratricopeptide (TPR) repeat protein
MRRLLSALAALAILCGVPCPAAADDWTDCKLSVPERRIAACTRIINRHDEGPTSIALAYTYRGNAYRNREDNERAIADFTKAMELDPNRASYNRGLVYAAKGDHDLAIAEYNEALRLAPNDAVTYNSRGNAYNAKGDRDRAIGDYDEAIRLDSKLALAYSNRGNAYNSKGERDRAIADFDSAIRIDPNYAVAYNNRGNAYRQKGERDRAIADFAKAIELDPNYARAYQNRGYVSQLKGEHDLAIADFNKAIEISPRNPGTYESRGYSYWKKNELDRAIADLDKAIEINPKYANAYNNRGNVYGSKGDLNRAIADFDKAIEVDAKFQWPYNNRGIAYLRKGDVDRAIADFDKAIEVDPTYVSAYFNRGNAFEKKNDNEHAIADFRKVLELPAPLETDRQRQEIARARIARLTQPQPQRGVTAPPPAQRVALVIGNSNYVNAGVLINPKNDANGIAAALRRLGFTKVIERYDLTREMMGQALKDFGDLAEGAEWAVVFFAGHGMEMNGVTYLVPSDAALKRDTHVTDETITLTQIQAKVDAASKLGLVILDSCRNNPFSARMVRTGGARSIGRGLAAIEPEGNVLVVYAAKHGTTASDGVGEHSPFTEALLAHIEEPGLEINFLFRKVRDDVRTKTQRQQEPFQYGSLSSEFLYFKAAANAR